MPPNYEIDTKATTLCGLETFMQTNKTDKASKGPVLVFFENCRSNNTCVLKIKDELRISLFKYHQATKEKIGLVEISYRDNDYVTAASSTKLKGYGQFLPLLMNLNNSVTINLGCLNQKNLSSKFITKLAYKFSSRFNHKRSKELLYRRKRHIYGKFFI